MAASKGKSSHAVQMIGSLMVALLIVIAAITVVTSRLGAGDDSGGGSGSSEEDGSGRGRGRGRGDSDLGEPARERFALAPGPPYSRLVQNVSIAPRFVPNLGQRTLRT